MQEILMESSAKSFEPLVVGMEIPVPEEYSQCFSKTDYGVYYHIQHNHIHGEETSGKLLVRDNRWNGALKAFVEKFDENNLPVALKVLRLSKSGKSVITQAIQG